MNYKNNLHKTSALACRLLIQNSYSKISENVSIRVANVQKPCQKFQDHPESCSAANEKGQSSCPDLGRAQVVKFVDVFSMKHLSIPCTLNCNVNINSKRKLYIESTLMAFMFIGF